MHPTSPYCGAKCDEIGESPSIGECACVPPPIVMYIKTPIGLCLPAPTGAVHITICH